MKELTRMREGIFDSPDSWDSFGTTPSTSAAASDEKEPEPVESNGANTSQAASPGKNENQSETSKPTDHGTE